MAPVMGSSLRDIPGAGGGRRRDRLPSAARTPRVRRLERRAQPGRPPAPKRQRPAAAIAAKGRRRSFGRQERLDRVNIAIALSFVALALVGALWLRSINQVSVTATGVEQGATITPQQAVGLTIELKVSPTSRLDSATLSFDGEDVTGDVNVERTDGGFAWHSPPGRGLDNGRHTIALEVPRVIHGTADWQLTFGVEPPT